MSNNLLGVVVGAGLILFPEPSTTLAGVAILTTSIATADGSKK